MDPGSSKRSMTPTGASSSPPLPSSKRTAVASTSTSSASISTAATLPPAPEDFINRIVQSFKKKMKKPTLLAQVKIILNQLGTPEDPTAASHFHKDPVAVEKLRDELKDLLIQLSSTSLRCGSYHAKSTTVSNFHSSSTGYWHLASVLNEVFQDCPDLSGKVPSLLVRLQSRINARKQTYETAKFKHGATSDKAFEAEYDWLVNCCSPEVIQKSVVETYATFGYSIPGSGFGFENDYDKLLVEMALNPKIGPHLEEWQGSANSVFDIVVSPENLNLIVPADGQKMAKIILNSKIPFFENKKSAGGLHELNVANPLEPSGRSFSQAVLDELRDNWIPSSLPNNLDYNAKKITLRSLRRLHSHSEMNLDFVNVIKHERDIVELAGLEHERNVVESRRPFPAAPETRYAKNLEDFATRLIGPLQDSLDEIRESYGYDSVAALEEFERAANFLLATKPSAVEDLLVVQENELFEFENNDDGSRRLAEIGPFSLFAGTIRHKEGKAHEMLQESVQAWEKRSKHEASPTIPPLAEDYPASIEKLVPHLLKELRGLLEDPRSLKLLAIANKDVFAEIVGGRFSLVEGIAHLTRSKARLWLHKDSLGPLLPSLVEILSDGVLLAELLPTAGFADLITENRIRLLVLKAASTNVHRAIAHAVKMDLKGMALSFEFFTTDGMPTFENPGSVYPGLKADPRWRITSLDFQDDKCDLYSLCARLIDFDLTQDITDRESFASVYVYESRQPISYYDGLSLDEYYTCPAWMYANYTYSPGLATANLRIHGMGHLGCKMGRGKVYETIGAPKEKLRVGGSSRSGGRGRKVEDEEMGGVDEEIKAEESDDGGVDD